MTTVYYKVLDGESSEDWREAIQQEIRALAEYNTWNYVQNNWM